ncbi:MAG: hypothetical protein QXP02_00560 [Desulfurococcaceae archaeon]
MNGENSLCSLKRIFNKLKVAFNMLDRISPGLTNRIDLYFHLRYGKSFVDILIENPRLCINDLNELYGGNSESVKYLLYMILKFALKGDIHLISNALKLFQDGKYDELINILCSINGVAG